jgi:hypothetical protein
VNREQFETRVLDLWMTSRVPLTRAHLQYATGVGRRRLNGWLDSMVSDGVLECDVDDEGEMLWTVPGAARPLDGPTSFAELDRKKQLLDQARRKLRDARGGRRPREQDAGLGIEALALARRASSALDRSPPDGADRKSLLVSAGLSLLGPLGWLYAGSLREALPAAGGALLIAAIVPTFLLMPVLWLAMPLSALVGLAYAWQYNCHGQRTALFLDDKKQDRD